MDRLLQTLQKGYFEELGESSNNHFPSMDKPPKLEEKPLPKHLRYAYLSPSSTFLVIISSLSSTKEERLLRELEKHKSAIDWTLADIKGIRSSMCMHRILLEENNKPSIKA